VNKKLRKKQLKREFKLRMKRSKERYRLEQIEKARRMFEQEQAALRASPQAVASKNRCDLEAKKRAEEDKARRRRLKKYVLSSTRHPKDVSLDSVVKRLINEGYQGINWD